jgi:hypothetical protein
MRVRVHERSGPEQDPQATQLLDDERVSLFDELPGDDGHPVGKLPPRADGLHECQAVPLPSRVVVGTECRRHVYDATAVFGRDERFADDDLVRRPGRILHPIERPLVARSDQHGAAVSIDNVPARLPILAKHAPEPSLGKNQRSTILARLPHHLDVRQLRIHRERHVRNERPRRRGPDQDPPSRRPKFVIRWSR